VRAIDANSATDTPSTPGAPRLLRTRRHARSMFARETTCSMSRSASTPRDSCRLIAEGRLVRTDFIADPETRRTSPCTSMFGPSPPQRLPTSSPRGCRGRELRWRVLRPLLTSLGPRSPLPANALASSTARGQTVRETSPDKNVNLPRGPRRLPASLESAARCAWPPRLATPAYYDVSVRRARFPGRLPPDPTSR
jgi:hypothetical protein